MDEQGNNHDNQVKKAIYKAAPLNWSGLFILLAILFSGAFTLLIMQVPNRQSIT